MGHANPFPESDYTPFGYLDNPFHSAILNRSGVIRSVPPLGFGFWARDLPWPYGNGFGHRRIPSYLSLLHLSVHCDGQALHSSEDFTTRNIDLVSRYHTKLMMGYDFGFRDLRFCGLRSWTGSVSGRCWNRATRPRQPFSPGRWSSTSPGTTGSRNPPFARAGTRC